MADLGRIAWRDRRWFAGALLLAAPISVALGRQMPDASWPETVALGMGIGLVLGLGSALIRESTDTTFRTEAQAERVLGLEVLAAVPWMRNAGDRRGRRRMLIWSLAAAIAMCGATVALQWRG